MFSGRQNSIQERSVVRNVDAIASKGKVFSPWQRQSVCRICLGNKVRVVRPPAEKTSAATRRKAYRVSITSLSS
jgi:hypothetical protein